VKPDEIAIGTSLLVFTQFLLSAVFLVVSNLIFDTSLRNELAVNAPATNATLVVEMGATGFRSLILNGDPSLAGVVLSYSNSVDRVFYLAAGIGALAAFTAFFLGWTDIRKKKTPSPGSEKA
jgi:hypothetical protein